MEPFSARPTDLIPILVPPWPRPSSFPSPPWLSSRPWSREGKEKGMNGEPCSSAIFFFLAQAAAFRSFATGALSIAIPAQGAKVLLVAAPTLIMLRQPVSLRVWIAAVLTVGAIYLLREHDGDKGERNRHFSTLAYAATAGACFAAFDVSIQKWSPAWGNHRFAPWAWP
jgi:drug/metabolite transporter (DMT)-like permease